MKYYQIPILELASGDKLSLKVYDFAGLKNGKKYYIQANIHGPEVVGTGVLLKLIKLLKSKPLKVGNIRVVVSANPISLNFKIGGYQVGYVNLNGTRYPSWNAIFKKEIDNKIDKLRVEDILARKLQELSLGFDIALDVHSAQNNIEFVYCYEKSVQLGKLLGTRHVVLLNENSFEGCFDQAFMEVNGKKSHGITLELSGKAFNEKYLNQWSNNIYDFLTHNNSSKLKDVLVWDSGSNKKYLSSKAGILVPIKELGSESKKGEVLVKVMGLSGSEEKIIAQGNGIVYRYPIAQSVSQGEIVVQVLERNIGKPSRIL